MSKQMDREKTPSTWLCRRASRKLTYSTALLVSAIFLSLLLGADSSQGAGPAKFCASPSIRDYEAPLRSLPPVAGLPVSKQLPFAPPDIEFGNLYIPPPQQSRLAYLGSTPTYQIKNASRHSTASLDWNILIRSSRIFQNGEATPIWESIQKVNSLGPGKSVKAKGKSMDTIGSYRIDITFSGDSGMLLGSYAEYVRIVPLQMTVRLGLSRQRAFPGSTVWSRVENLGTQLVGYGYEQNVERLDHGRWIALPSDPVFQPLLVAGSGMAGQCSPIQIPKYAMPGRYRVRNKVSSVFPERGKQHPLLAYFKVMSR